MNSVKLQDIRFFLNLFIYFWLHWVFIAACGLSLVATSGGYSLLWCVGFSLQWLLSLWSMGSRHAGFSSYGSQALEHRLSRVRAQFLHGIWDLPGPGLKPVSPALAGGFLTTAPPGKPQDIRLIYRNLLHFITLTMKYQKEKIKTIFHLNSCQKIKYLGINLTKEMKRPIC